MKKIFTLVFFALAAMSANAQINLFDAADCDADGWLWLNTQEKIDKYVGNATDMKDPNGFDWENYTVNPNGKPIQLAFANISPDYPASFANPDVMGTDAAGHVIGEEGYESSEAKTGCIMLAGASAQMSPNGGCLILNLPSCESISLYMSSEASYLGRTLLLTPGFSLGVDDSAEGDPQWTGHTKAIYTKATLFSKLHGAGQWQWEGIESLNNGNNEGMTFKSEGPVFFAFQNCHRYPIYIHGIKVIKSGTAGINTIAANSNAKATVYNLAGQRVAGTQKGLYIVNGKKYVVK